MATIRTIKIADLIFDDRNANKGTKRGRELIARSVKNYGAGRSILIDKQNRVIAGNKTLEAAIAAGKTEISVVDSDGDTFVAVMRTDLDLKRHKKARELAIADNRTNEVDLNWDHDILADLEVDLTEFFNEKELKDLIDAPPAEPVKFFSDEQIEAEIVRAFPQRSAVEVVAEVITPAMAMAQFNDLANGKRGGYYISALFNPHRLETDGDLRRSRNYIAGCRTPEMQKTAAQFLVRMRGGNVHPSDFVKYSGVGWAGYGQMVYEFRPEIARDLYKRYCSTKSPRVLDPCHGWGGRVIGWLAANLGGEYVGYDPATRTHEGVLKLIDWLAGSKSKSKARVVCSPFESVQLKPNSFDFALTSPPYFDSEKYSDEATQSMKRFATYDDWVAGFYTVLIQSTLTALKRGSTFVLNVGNKTYPLTKSAITIAEALGAKVAKLDDYAIGRPETDDEDVDHHEDFLAITKP